MQDNGDGSGDWAGVGTGTGTGWRTLLDEHNNKMGTRTGSGRVKERRRSARNHTRVVDAIWETGET